MLNSRKKYSYAGTKEVANVKTGELEKSTLLKQTTKDLNFVKIFLPERGYNMYPPEMITSAIELFNYLLVIMDRQNISIAPTVEINERTNMSESTICRGRIQLLEFDFMRQRGQGIFMINPSKACKADGEKRIELFNAYNELKKGK